MTNYQICKPKSSTFFIYIRTRLVFEHQAKMFVRQGVDSEHLKVCPHDQKYYALEPIDTDQFFFFCDSKSSESDSILGSYYAKRYTRLPTLYYYPFGFQKLWGVDHNHLLHIFSSHISQQLILQW